MVFCFVLMGGCALYFVLDNCVILIFLLQVTKDVSLLSRWMAFDLYIREVDSLRFELSMNRCSDRLSRLAHEILEKGQRTKILMIGLDILAIDWMS